jgi:hypothetical protein
LFMTGYSFNAVVHQSTVDAGIEILHKPMTEAVLEEKVRAVFNQASPHHRDDVAAGYLAGTKAR